MCIGKGYVDGYTMKQLMSRHRKCCTLFGIYTPGGPGDPLCPRVPSPGLPLSPFSPGSPVVLEVKKVIEPFWQVMKPKIFSSINTKI